MHRTTLTASTLAVLLLVPAAVLRADDAPKGDKDLQGTWQVVKEVRDGQEHPPPDKGAPVVTFDGDTLTIKVGDDVHKATIKVDASKTPHTFDAVIEDGEQKGKTVKAVYEIKGDELKVCHGKPDTDRPTELSAKEGSGLTVITLQRVKK